MSRCIMLLALFCGAIAWSPTAHAQGLWFGGFGFGPGFYGSGFSPYGFGSLGTYGGFTPIGYGYPAAWSRVSAPRPVVAYAAPPRPVVAARPAVALPLNRAYRRIYRRGW